MDRPATVLLVGDFDNEHVDIAELCSRFGWAVKRVPSLTEDMLLPHDEILARIVDITPGNGAAVQEGCRRDPGNPWIACCRFGSSNPWLDSEDSGLFHLIRRPFHEREVLQSLGFVDALLSRRRRALFALPARGAAA